MDRHEKSCLCSACSEVTHIYYEKSVHLKHNLKLLEQAHCAHCWRPLKIASSWPGPKESQRPPYGNGSSIMVAQCGHLYHGTCAGKASHCALCFSSIQKLIPLHYQELPRCTTENPTESRTSKPTPGPDETGTSEKLEELIQSLKDKIEHISTEIVQLRRQLAKPPPPRRWR
jgi:hypothetical protein